MKRLELLSGSLLLAATYHSNQRRKSDATPYINHILEVVDLLIDVGKVSDVHELCAAALHDSIEDTKITRKMIARKFGGEVIDLVNALTDDKKLTLIERRAATLNKLSVAPNSVKRIKLADICSNATAIPDGWTAERLNEYYNWLDDVAKKCRPASEALYLEYLSRRRST